MARPLSFCILILVLALVPGAMLRSGSFEEDDSDCLSWPVAVFFADTIRQTVQMQRFPDVFVRSIEFAPSTFISRAPPA
jgi:hypothetical protein